MDILAGRQTYLLTEWWTGIDRLMATWGDTDWEVGLKRTQLDEEKENKTAEQRERGQNEGGVCDCLWFGLIPQKDMQLPGTMTLWLNSVPSPDTQRKEHAHNKCSHNAEGMLGNGNTNTHICAHTPLRCTWEQKCLQTHSQQADWVHIVVIGGIPVQGVCVIGRD